MTPPSPPFYQLFVSYFYKLTKFGKINCMEFLEYTCIFSGKNQVT